MKKYIKPSLTVSELGVKNHILGLSKGVGTADASDTPLSREEEEFFWDEEQGW